MTKIINLFFVCFLVFFSTTPLQAGYERHLASGLSFCGETVPLDQPELFRSVDQNLILLAEAKSRIWLTLRRAQRFLPVVELELKRAGVPADLKYISMSITSLDPGYNSGGRGMWRLRTSEARALGLRVDKNVDERLDPAASTAAAAKLLKNLSTTTGSWTSAMATHLLGGKAMNQAIAEAGGEKNFYKIYFSNELMQMPTMVLAGKALFSNPQAFGYDQKSDRGWPVLSTKRTKLDKNTTIRALATQYKSDLKTFRDMNPHLLTDFVPAEVTINIP